MPKGAKSTRGKEIDPSQLDFLNLAEATQEIQKTADQLGVNTDTLLSGFVPDQSVTIVKHPVKQETARKRLEKNIAKYGGDINWIGHT